MSPGPHARLSALREAQARRFVERAGADDADGTELQALRARLQLTEQALAEADRRAPGRHRPLLAAGLAIALLCSAAAAIRLPRAAFSAEIEASAVTLEMARAGQLGGLAIDGTLGVQGATDADSAHPALRAQARAAGGAFSLRGAGLRLQRLAWDDGSVLRLEAGVDHLGATVETTRPMTVLALDLHGRATLEGASAWTADFGLGEWLTVASGAPAAGGRAAPLALRLEGHPRSPPAWRLAGVQAVAFVERAAGEDGSARFPSSLRKASLTLPQTDARIELHEGDRLLLGDLRLERCELLAGPTLRLRLSGSAGDLRSVVGGFERALKPSWLEWLVNNHQLALIWGSAMFLWSVRASWQRLFGTS